MTDYLYLMFTVLLTLHVLMHFLHVPWIYCTLLCEVGVSTCKTVVHCGIGNPISRYPISDLTRIGFPIKTPHAITR